LAGIYKKYNEQGFHIIGLESQLSAAPAISTMAKARNLDWQLTIGGNLKGANVSSLPHNFLFAADGKMAAENLHGKELEDKVKELIKESAGALAGAGPYVKLGALAAQVKTGMGLGSVLKALTAKKASKDAAEAAEANMMYDALHGGGRELLELALEKKSTAPLEAVTRLDKLALQFTGDELGTKASQEAAAMKKDPAIKKEIDAEVMWKQIEAASDKLKPVRGSTDPADEAFRKANMPVIQGMMGGCQALNQRFPGTAAAQKATDLMGQYR